MSVDPRRELIHKGMYIRGGPIAPPEMRELHRQRFAEPEPPTLDEIRERLKSLADKIAALRS